MRLGREFISSCNAMLRLPGESKGADMETAYAKDIAMKVYYSLEAIEDE